MKTVTRWSPFQELEEVSNRLNRFFGERTAMSMDADWAPPVDIIETDTDYIIKAELPEIDRKDVKVMVEDSVLTVKGERKKETESKDKRLHRIERFYGRFMRSFDLPENVNSKEIKADFKDGLLKIKIHKTDKPAVEAINVSVN